MGTAETFTMSEAAELCGVSVDTIKRRRRDGVFPRATRRDGTTTGAWVIPVGDLVDAGLYTPDPDADPVEPSAVLRLSRAERELAELRVRVEAHAAIVEAKEVLVAELRETNRRLMGSIELLARGGGA